MADFLSTGSDLSKLISELSQSSQPTRRDKVLDTCQLSGKIASLLALKPTDHLLEVGLANGRFSNDWRALAGNVHCTGVDYCADNVRAATHYYQDWVINHCADFAIMAGTTLPLKNNQFNVTICRLPLTDWPSPLQAFIELNRVATANATLCVIDGFEQTAELSEKPQSVANLVSSAGFMITATHPFTSHRLDNEQVVTERVNIIVAKKPHCRFLLDWESRQH